jgi:hypothetical protein
LSQIGDSRVSRMPSASVFTGNSPLSGITTDLPSNAAFQSQRLAFMPSVKASPCLAPSDSTRSR